MLTTADRHYIDLILDPAKVWPKDCERLKAIINGLEADNNDLRKSLAHEIDMGAQRAIPAETERDAIKADLAEVLVHETAALNQAIDEKRKREAAEAALARANKALRALAAGLDKFADTDSERAVVAEVLKAVQENTP